MRPEENFEPFLIFAFSFLAFSLLERFTFEKIKEDDLMFSLQIQNPEMNLIDLIEDKEPSSTIKNQEFDHIFQNERREFQKLEHKKIRGLILSTVSSGLIFSAIFMVINPSFDYVLPNVSDLAIEDSAYLKIIQGHPDSEKSDKNQKVQFKLSTGATKKISLKTPNLIEVSVRSSALTLPPLFLRDVEITPAPSPTSKKNSEIKLQMNAEDHGQIAGKILYKSSFSVTQDTQIVLPSLFSQNPVAIILVEKTFEPKVQLSLNEKMDPWPDDKPLPLDISLQADRPLQEVSLSIRVGDRTFRELVNNISNEHTLTFDTRYPLALERFTQDDVIEMEIIAEAIDRSLPQPFIGRSQAIHVKVVSSYGRYRQTLENLRQVKRPLEQAIKDGAGQVDKSNLQKMAEVNQQSKTTPFFDELDRMQLQNMQNSLSEMSQDHQDAETKSSDLYDLNDKIGEFLEEHELLDDRERDRDFFVSARGLSRQLEKNSPYTETLKKKIVQFLDERLERWKIRVNRLDQIAKLSKWPKISERRLFQEPIEKLQSTEQTPSGTKSSGTKQKSSGTEPPPQQQQESLSQTVESYKQWMEELEGLEDEEKLQREKGRQEALISAREELMAIQNRQTAISSRLDKAESRSESDLKNIWPLTRADQNSNVKDTAKLMQKMKSLSNRSSERLSLALDSMKKTLQNGGENQFREAETHSDLANRLLRQAEKSSQEKDSGQRRQRRRVAGDNYYGRALSGGDIDINREYEVDKRYRESILEEIQEAPEYEGKNKALLNRFLRQIIR